MESDLDLDALLAIVRKRTPGEWCLDPTRPHSVLVVEDQTICGIVRNAFDYDADAIVAAVNNFEAVAERCKRAEARIKNAENERDARRSRKIQCEHNDVTIAELTRQRDELLATLRNIADKDDYAADDPHGCLDCIIGIAKDSVKGMADGKA